MAILEQLIEDNVQWVAASNQPMFDTDINYDEIAKKRLDLVRKWKILDQEERDKYRDINEYTEQNGVPDLKSVNFIPSKNYSLIRREVSKKLSSNSNINILPVDSLDFSNSVIELAEGMENIDEIRSLYRVRKLTTGDSTNAGINSDEAKRLKNCFSQGRELYLSGQSGSLMVKPLNFFYALTAYSYGVIILNNPLRYNKGNLPGSHGMAYLPDIIQVQFGGDCARGTFSDLFTAFPAHLIKTPHLEIYIDCTESVVEFYNNRFSVSLGTLMSMVPEMSEYYKLTTGRNSRCFPLEISNSNDARNLTWELHIGNGEIRPAGEVIEQSFPGFEKSERYGKVIISIPYSQFPSVKACIYTDIRGNLWFVENPFFPVMLPELAVHFLISSIFSNVMRYRPDEWGSVLTNEVSSNISLITRHYFSVFERKFFLLVLRSASRYFPYAI